MMVAALTSGTTSWDISGRKVHILMIIIIMIIKLMLLIMIWFHLIWFDSLDQIYFNIYMILTYFIWSLHIYLAYYMIPAYLHSLNNIINIFKNEIQQYIKNYMSTSYNNMMRTYSFSRNKWKKYVPNIFFMFAPTNIY